MFFPMLRRRAKWVFVFLALAFIVGFVVFGVGTGTGGGGLGDLFNGSSGSAKGGPSASAAQKKIAANPKDAAAYSELATALQTSGDTNGAINALVHYTNLKPKSSAALNRLAALYTGRARNLTTQLQSAQAQVSAVTPNSFLEPPLLSPSSKKHPGQPLIGQPIIDSTLATSANSLFSKLQAEQKTAFTKATAIYEQLAALHPKDPQTQLELGSIAQQSGNTATAIIAYKKFLRLAPNDPTAKLVKQQLKFLQPVPIKPTKPKPKH